MPDQRRLNTISLDKQIHVYSFDTSAFFTDEEHQIEIEINQHCMQKMKLKSEREILSRYLAGNLAEEKAKAQYRTLYRMRKDDIVSLGDKVRVQQIGRELKATNQSIKLLKAELASLLHQHRSTRQLRIEYVVDKNIISVFESMLTRTLGMHTGGLYDDFMVVRTYYFDVLEDLILNGFTYNGERYMCFTASAGQIRTKKTVFIKERVWEKYQKTLMCGLTVQRINELGGININKYLAYLALCNSATDPWNDFEISKSIVVDDMETMVGGLVDFIDHKTYQIERKWMDIPITHTDGCGMVLPQCCAKNTMVRLPWVKGLLAVFPFDRFIKEADRKEPGQNHGIVVDIYGKEHDILAEDIQVIFTKSQFKMYKYYTDWQEYINCYYENGCSAGKCNEEEDFLPDAKLNYQMLQTLTDITQDELEALAGRSVNKILRIASDRNTMLDVFGATAQYKDKNAFQECLSLYPELLSDPYTKEMLRQIKKNLVTEAKAAKLDLSAKYMFLVPDLYAFCEWLFLGERNPVGLLADGEVSCCLYRQFDKLDCLRSPHLYREHAVRRNVVNQATRRWFTPNAIYTSCHDLISKILQFDCDGDKSLVCADRLLVPIAERNMRDIVPLYYEMAKAGAVIVTPTEIFKGLHAAYTGGNIGVISNDITKIWNSQKPDLDAVKILCMENNFVIDYAKTLYRPSRPDEINTRLSQITSVKAPYFFRYAKGKENTQVQRANSSVVNQLDEIIPNKRMSFSAKNIGVFHYEYMLQNPTAKIAVAPEVSELYGEIEKQYRYSINFYEDESNFAYVRKSILERFAKLDYSMEQICDMLVKHLFYSKQSRRKNVFWMCFGEMVLANLQRNLPKGSIQCKKCGERFIPVLPQQKLCMGCTTYHPIGNKVVKCIDCGEAFTVDARNMKKVRCDKCQVEYRKAWDRERKRRNAA